MGAYLSGPDQTTLITNVSLFGIALSKAVMILSVPSMPPVDGLC